MNCASACLRISAVFCVFCSLCCVAEGALHSQLLQNFLASLRRLIRYQALCASAVALLQSVQVPACAKHGAGC